MTTIAEESEKLLQFSQKEDRLTFFYPKGDDENMPYFYVKIVTEEDKAPSTLEELKTLESHLIYIQGTKPKQYKIPKDSKRLILIKSSKSLGSSHYSAQIIPKKIKLSFEGSRGGSNHPIVLPDETKFVATCDSSRSIASEEPVILPDATKIKICAFN